MEVFAAKLMGAYHWLINLIKRDETDDFWEKEAGSLGHLDGDPVEIIRGIREKLSKEPVDLDEINKL